MADSDQTESDELGLIFDDQLDDVIFDMVMSSDLSGSDRKRRRTSMSGKLPNVERNFEQGHRRIYDDFFSDNPTFSEDKLQRRFRMPAQLFKHIMKTVEDSNPGGNV